MVKRILALSLLMAGLMVMSACGDAGGARRRDNLDALDAIASQAYACPNALYPTITTFKNDNVMWCCDNIGNMIFDNAGDSYACIRAVPNVCKSPMYPSYQLTTFDKTTYSYCCTSPTSDNCLEA